MKFEVGKKYSIGGMPDKQYQCRALFESAVFGPAIIFCTDAEDWVFYLQDIERGDHGAVKEIKEPVIHKRHVTWFKRSADHPVEASEPTKAPTFKNIWEARYPGHVWLACMEVTYEEK